MSKIEGIMLHAKVYASKSNKKECNKTPQSPQNNYEMRNIFWNASS